MTGKRRVDEQTAAETIGEMTFKYPDYSNKEIYAICRLRQSTAVSMEQVVRHMRELRRKRDEAFK